jgi:hypothetical protein
MGRHLSTALSLLSVLVCLPGTALCQSVDQSHLVTDPNHGFAVERLTTNSINAQTFTVGLAGKLAGVDFQMWRSPVPASTDLVVHVLPTDPSGVPLLTPLYSVNVPISDVPEFAGHIPFDPPILHVDLLAANLVMEVGDVFAIGLSRFGHPSAPWTLWASNDNVDYPGGSYYDGTDGVLTKFAADAGFQTYVVPEPGSICMLVLGCVGLRLHGRR